MQGGIKILAWIGVGRVLVCGPAFFVFAALALSTVPAYAQVDLSGTWNTRQHEDQPDRGPGVGLGDYTGMPITEGARRWADHSGRCGPVPSDA